MSEPQPTLSTTMEVIPPSQPISDLSNTVMDDVDVQAEVDLLHATFPDGKSEIHSNDVIENLAQNLNSTIPTQKEFEDYQYELDELVMNCFELVVAKGFSEFLGPNKWKLPDPVSLENFEKFSFDYPSLLVTYTDNLPTVMHKDKRYIHIPTPPGVQDPMLDAFLCRINSALMQNPLEVVDDHESYYDKDTRPFEIASTIIQHYGTIHNLFRMLKVATAVGTENVKFELPLPKTFWYSLYTFVLRFDKHHTEMASNIGLGYISYLTDVSSVLTTLNQNDLFIAKYLPEEWNQPFHVLLAEKMHVTPSELDIVNPTFRDRIKSFFAVVSRANSHQAFKILNSAGIPYAVATLGSMAIVIASPFTVSATTSIGVVALGSIATVSSASYAFYSYFKKHRVSPLAFARNSLDKIHSAFDLLTNVLGAIAKVFSVPLKVLDAISTMIVALVALSGTETVSSRVAIGYLFTRVLAHIYPNIIDSIIDTFTNLSTRLSQRIFGQMTAQAGSAEDVSALGGAVTSVANIFGSLFGYKHAPITKEEITNMHAVHSAYTLVNDLKSLVNFSVTLITSSFQFCYTRWTGHPLFIGDSEVLIAKADAWIADVRTLQTRSKQDAGVYSDLELCNQIDSLAIEGDVIALSFARAKITSSIFPAFFHFQKTIYDLKSVADHARRIGFGRTEPIWVHVDGKPGLGKSTMVQQLCSDVSVFGLGRPFTEAMVYSKTFTKDATDAYWSGYANQPFFLCEEIWQYNDEELRAATATLFNQLVNVHAHVLPMADIASKGNTIFDTPFILSTSNGSVNNRPTFSKMQSPDSVYRRMTFECTLRLKPGRVNDPTKYDSTSWFIDIVKMRGDSRQCAYGLSYVEFLQRVLTEYTRNQTTVTRNVVKYLNTETPRQRLERWIGPKAASKVTDDKIAERLKELMPLAPFKTQGKDDVNWKGQVLEFFATRKLKGYPPDFDVINSGPPHMQEFRFRFKGELVNPTPYASKKLAEQAAYKLFLQKKDPVLYHDVIGDETEKVVPAHVDVLATSRDKSPPPVYRVTNTAPVPKPETNWQALCAELCITNHIPFPALFVAQKLSGYTWDAPSLSTTLIFPDYRSALQDGYRTWVLSVSPGLINPMKTQGMLDGVKALSTSLANWWNKPVDNVDQTFKQKFLNFREKVVFSLSLAFATAAGSCWLGEDGMSFAFKVATGTAILLSFAAFLHYITKNKEIITGVFKSQSYGADFKSRRNQVKTATRVTHRHGGMRRVTSNPLQEQGGSDLQTADLIWKNLCQVGYVGVRSHLFFIDSTIAVAPLHSFRELVSLERKTIRVFAESEGEVELTFEKDFDLVVNSGSDMLFFNFHTPKLSQRRNLAKHLVKSTDLNPEYNQAIACVVKRNGKMFVMRSPKSYLVENKEYHGESGTLNASLAMLVNMPTIDGECGAPYFSTDDKDVRKIFGIHIAGDKHQGMAQILSLEAYEEAREAFSFTTQSKLDPLVVPEDILEEAKLFCDEIENKPGDGVDYPSTVVVIGKLKPQYKIRQPPRSELKESLIYGVLGVPERTPVKLSKYDVHRGLTPFQRSMQKFALPNLQESDVDPEVIEALDLAADVILTALPKAKGVVFTLDEALNGHPKYQYFRRIDDSTSIGWPLTQEKLASGVIAKGKKYLLDEVDGRFVLKPEFQEEYERSWENLLTRLPLRDRTFQISLKDELRDTDPSSPVETCEGECPHKQYKPRIFNPLPFFYQLHQRRLYGEFVNMMMEWHNEGFSRVGVNPHSLEWTMLYKYIADMIYHKDGDFKGFDASQPRFLGMKGYALINEWYARTKHNIEDLQRRRVITDTMKLQIMAVMDRLIAVYKGNPSGSFLTTVLNEVLVMLTMMVVYYIYCKRDLKQPRTMSQVYGDIRCPSLGDDHILSENKCIPFLRLQELVQQFFGMKYTCAAKTAAALDDKPLSELTFLKRRFRCADGLVFAPLEMGVIISMVSFVHKKIDPYKATRDNAETAIRELYHYGKEVFEEKTMLINEALERVGIPPIPLTFSSLDESYRGGNFEIDLLGVLQYPHQFQSQGLEDGNKEEGTAPTTSQIAITAVSDLSTMVEEKSLTKSSGYGKTDPYADQGLKVVLERVYYKNFQWTASQIFGQDIYSLDLPKDHIVGNDNLISKLSKFQFFRSATLVQLRVNSTSFHTGRLLVAWIPHYKDSGTVGRKKAYELSDIYAASCNEHVILSANSTGTVSFVIPYVAPQQYFDLSHLDTSESEGYFGYVKVFVLSPLLISSSVTVPPVNIAVSISFLDPEVAGMTSYSIPPSAKEKKKLKPYRVIDNDYSNGSIKGVFKTQGLIGESEKPVPQNDAPAVEQQKVSKSGVVSSTLDTIGTIASYFTEFPVIGGIASLVSPIAKFGASIASSLGFDKPTSAEVPTRIIVTPFPNLAEGKGLDPSQVIGLTVENGVSSDPKIMGDLKDYTQISNYASVPALIGRYQVTNGEEGDVVFSRIVTPNDCYTDTDPSGGINLFRTPLNAVADKFRYWTGSLQYAVYITVPHFVSFRFRMSWLPSYLHKPVDTADGAGDYVSKVVDVNGSQVFYFSIPYLQTTPWCASLPLPVITDTGADANQHGTNNGVIQFSIVNDMTYTDSAVPPTVDIALYMAAGPDFRVACPRAPWNHIQLGPLSSPLKTQSIPPEVTAYPRRLFEYTFEPLVSPVSVQMVTGINHGEEVVSLKTLSHRYTRVVPISPWVVVPGDFEANGLLLSPEIYGSSNTDILDAKYDLDNMFLFNRGSKRFMAYKKNCLNYNPVILMAKNVYNIGFTDVYSRPVDDEDNVLGSDGQVLGEMELSPAFHFQVPFYDNVVMRTSKYQYPEDVVQEVIPKLLAVNPSVGNFPVEIYEARADDFSWGWPKTPLKAVWMTPPSDSLIPNGKEEEVQDSSKIGGNLPNAQNDKLLLTDLNAHSYPKK